MENDLGISQNLPGLINGAHGLSIAGKFCFEHELNKSNTAQRFFLVKSEGEVAEFKNQFKLGLVIN